MLDQPGKAAVIKSYARKFNCPVLVETGTYYGDTVAACLTDFKRIFSIEVGLSLVRKARERFKDYPHVHIIGGDSGALLPGVLSVAWEPAVFWLDAHYSGGDTCQGEHVTAICGDMEAVVSLCDPRSVVLIDDARDFVPEKGYPPLVPFVMKIKEVMPAHDVWLEDDIIRAVPSEAAMSIDFEAVSNANDCADFIKPMAQRLLQGKGLDIGCGMKKVVPFATGVDNASFYGKECVAEERRDASDLSGLEGQDFVFSSHLLEHMDDWKKTLSEWVRVLRPGGLLFLYLPNPRGYGRWGKIPCPSHKHDLYPDMVKAEVETLKCSVIDWESKFDRYAGYHIVARKEGD